MNSKNKNIRDLHRGINEFKRSYHPRSNLVMDEKADLLADSNNTVNRWESYFSRNSSRKPKFIVSSWGKISTIK
jgi:ribosome biogenesis GTPase A